MLNTIEDWVIISGWVLLLILIVVVHFFQKRKFEEQDRRCDEELDDFLKYMKKNSVPLKSSCCSCREHKKTNKLKVVP